MSTAVEEQQQQNTEVPQEEAQVEEPVDLELQSQMKNVTVDESAFSQPQKTKNKKEETKKSKKNKGEDFLEFASKNNIQINIEYEEDKYGAHGKRSYEKKPIDKKKLDQRGNMPYNNKPQYNHKRPYNQSNQNGSKYNNRSQQGYYDQNARIQMKFGGNKFDACNFQRGLEQPPQYYRQNPKFTNDEEIRKYLEEMFSVSNWNRDWYLRKKISEDGKIEVNDIWSYYPIKNNHIDYDKLKSIIGNIDTLEIKEVGELKLVEIKKFKEMKLETIEALSALKKQMKMQQMQQNMMYQRPYMNYIHLQNNYFIPVQNYYPMPGYMQQVYMTPQPQPYATPQPYVGPHQEA